MHEARSIDGNRRSHLLEIKCMNPLDDSSDWAIKNPEIRKKSSTPRYPYFTGHKDA
jgi:hypothetical protein